MGLKKDTIQSMYSFKMINVYFLDIICGSYVIMNALVKIHYAMQQCENGSNYRTS